MNKAEFTALTEYNRRPKVLRGSLLKNQAPRTLLWGYDTDRNSWHVYLNEHGVIVCVKYMFSGSLISVMEEKHLVSNEEYVPNKRLYPEACDLEFSKMLIESGVRLPWTSFNEDRVPKQWHGKRLEELYPA